MGANVLSMSSTALCNILLIVATMKMRMAHRLGLWCLGTFCGLQVERLLQPLCVVFRVTKWLMQCELCLSSQIIWERLKDLSSLAENGLMDV